METKSVVAWAFVIGHDIGKPLLCKWAAPTKEALIRDLGERAYRGGCYRAVRVRITEIPPKKAKRKGKR